MLKIFAKKKKKAWDRYNKKSLVNLSDKISDVINNISFIVIFKFGIILLLFYHNLKVTQIFYNTELNEFL